MIYKNMGYYMTLQEAALRTKIIYIYRYFCMKKREKWKRKATFGIEKKFSIKMKYERILEQDTISKP